MKENIRAEMKKSHEEVENLQNQCKRQTEEIDYLRDQILYDQSRSMRSNLMFYGLHETNPKEDSESLIRDFINEILDIDTQNIEIERAHRMGGWRAGKKRAIVVKFLRYKDKELIRQAAPRKLMNTLRLKTF